MAVRRRNVEKEEDVLEETDQQRHELVSNSKIEKNEVECTLQDTGSILLLLLLYTLQGIPLGLSGSIPFLLQGKVGYADQATFSLVSWPFSLKLLWAPLVDSMYIKSFGRRKSWLVPVQIFVSFLMLVGSHYVEDMLGDGKDHTPKIKSLTLFFFMLYFLMATQDIAVDGWALTMLSRKNVAYASTCNTVGQTLGYFAAYVGFLALNDPNTCNSYLRWEASDVGLISLGGFMSFWGWIMLITTIGVWIFKKEVEEKDLHPMGIRETYHELLRILRLPSIISLSFFLLTCKIGFAAAETVAPLKVVEYGLAKEKLALLTPILVPIGILIPIFLSKHSKGSEPLNMFMIGYPFRLLIGLLYAGVVWYTKWVLTNNGELTYSYYLYLFICSVLHSISMNMMFVSVMAFFTKISDPAIGGTYMTYLNTITNLGGKQCTSSIASLDNLHCKKNATTFECLHPEETCQVVWDGFFIEIGICFVAGIVWFLLCSRKMTHLQSLPSSFWRVKKE